VVRVKRAGKAEAHNRDPVLLVVYDLGGQRTGVGVVNSFPVDGMMYFGCAVVIFE